MFYVGLEVVSHDPLIPLTHKVQNQPTENKMYTTTKQNELHSKCDCT